MREKGRSEREEGRPTDQLSRTSERKHSPAASFCQEEKKKKKKEKKKEEKVELTSHLENDNNSFGVTCRC